MHPLAVTHFTLVSSLGLGCAETVRALREQRSGLHACAFETVDLPTFVGQVADQQLTPLPAHLTHWESRNNRLAQLVLMQDEMAQHLLHARERYGAQRIGVFLGTSTSGILSTELAYRRRDAASGALPEDFNYAGTQNNFSLAGYVRECLGLSGPALVVSTACSSSAKVFGTAARMIAAGVCDAALVGGVDSLCLTTLYGFHSLGLLSEAPCRPFDARRNGISIGEAAGFALLERVRPGDDSPLLLGVGESSDAYHMSSPHPEGLGARLAMQQALSEAGLEAQDIDYLNAHGTATKSNDSAEDAAIFDLFGTHVACSSTKGWTGHTLGAAGITEAVISLLALRNALMPGMPHSSERDASLKARYLRQHEPRALQHVMSNSFGFGGSNCSLVFGLP